MKITHVPAEKDRSPIQIVLDKVSDSDLKEELGDVLEAAHKDAGRASEAWKKHAGDLEPGEIGADAEDKFYLGCEGSGAYELDGKTRWLPHSGPSVKVIEAHELVFLGKGKDLPEAPPEAPEEASEEPEEEKPESLLQAVDNLLNAIENRYKENGASTLDDAAAAVRKLL